MPKKSSSLTSTDSTAPARAPSWEAAKGHADSARSKAKEAVLAAIACGRELAAIRANLEMTQGLRTDRRTLPGGAANWPELVRTRVGISDDTAYRWMADADRYDLLLAMSKGLPVTTDGKTIEPSSEVQEVAEEILSRIHDGELRPSRAWAGVQGALAAAHRADTTGLPGGGRAATDHHANIRVALTKLRTSLSAEIWRASEQDSHGLPCDWDFLKTEILTILRNAPDEIKEGARRVLG